MHPVARADDNPTPPKAVQQQLSVEPGKRKSGAGLQFVAPQHSLSNMHPVTAPSVAQHVSPAPHRRAHASCFTIIQIPPAHIHCTVLGRNWRCWVLISRGIMCRRRRTVTREVGNGAGIAAVGDVGRASGRPEADACLALAQAGKLQPTTHASGSVARVVVRARVRDGARRTGLHVCWPATHVTRPHWSGRVWSHSHVHVDCDAGSGYGLG